MKSIMSADLNEQWPPRVEFFTSLQYRVLESKWMVYGWYMDGYWMVLGYSEGSNVRS
jgi:hypothetical protein